MAERAILYARVSGDDRGKDGRNLAGQLKMCQEYAQEHKYTIIEELSEDDRGASGADIDLPKLTHIRDMAQAGEFDVLVVREIDRLSRSLAKQLIVEEELEQAGVQIEYVLGAYDDTPEGDLQKHVKAAIAEYERAKITERMGRGRRQMVKSGNVLVHGQAPYGYRIAKVGGKRTLAIDENEARIVRLIFTWYADGDETGKKLGSRAIARQLTKMGAPTMKDRSGKGYKKRGYGKWADGSIIAMINNETYIGRWYYGKKRSATELNPREHWLMVEVPAIISDDLWQRAQDQKERNKERASRNTTYNYLVGRRTTCGRCGSTMYGKCTTTGGRLYQYYSCAANAGNIVGKNCDMPYFRADHVDMTVWEWVEEYLTNPAKLANGLRQKQREQHELAKPLRERLGVIEGLLADHRTQLERALDLYLSGDFPKEMLTERKALLEKTIGSLGQERDSLLERLERQTITDDQIRTIAEFGLKVRKGLDIANADFDVRRHLIDMLEMEVTLAIEDEQKIVYVHCLVGRDRLLINNSSTCRKNPLEPAASPTSP